MMQEIVLRDYQKQAIEKVKWDMDKPGNSLLVLPTGSGKSIVVAYLAKELNCDVLILQPSKEILEQNKAKLLSYVPEEEVGVFSASMNEKVIRKYTLATIGSIYKIPEKFNHFKIVLLDECHLLNHKDVGSMFASFLKAIGNPKVIGTTATPYRNVQGYHRFPDGSMECKITLKLINRMRPLFWNRILFNINSQELFNSGFLCPLRYFDASIARHEEMKLNNAGTDFDMDDYEVRLTKKQDRVHKGVQWARQQYKSILVFCPSVASATKYAQATPGSASVHAKTPPKERAKIISDFKEGIVPIVFNMGVLTTGFDHPALDCIILARPTRSVGLYYQMLGRGVRPAPGKEHCAVIDFTSTVREIGRIESIRLDKDETGKWELYADSGRWHNRMLYSWKKEAPINHPYAKTRY